MQVEVGSIFEGKVTGITKFGAFVDFAQGKKGMVHISEVSSTFVKEIKDFVKEGQDVKVKVISVSDDGKIALSMKKAEPMEKPAPVPQRIQRPKRVEFVHEPQRPSRPGDFEWQNKSQGGNFEDMMSRFKQTSDEKMSDLKRINETKRGGGYSRRDSR